jgi:hypothetical protein
MCTSPIYAHRGHASRCSRSTSNIFILQFIWSIPPWALIPKTESQTLFDRMNSDQFFICCVHSSNVGNVSSAYDDHMSYICIEKCYTPMKTVSERSKSSSKWLFKPEEHRLIRGRKILSSVWGWISRCPDSLHEFRIFGPFVESMSCQFRSIDETYEIYEDYRVSALQAFGASARVALDECKTPTLATNSTAEYWHLSICSEKKRKDCRFPVNETESPQS